MAWTLSLPIAQPSDYGERAKEILEATNVTGGLIVHIGCGDGRLTAALRANDSCLVHGLDSKPRNVEKARQYIRSLGIYGPVSVVGFDGQRLPYVDNLVNLVVAEELGDVPMAEVMRVLAPGGPAYIRRGGKWAKVVKPWPDEIDEWTHYLHGPDGNPVAQDRRVGPPKHYQWIAGPLWMRSHESDASVRALVTARGKLFYIADEAPISLVGPNSPPDKWFLVARDAFNGVLLWKVPIKDWGWRAWKPSWFTPRPGDIPLNIAKRLVAAGDKVYVTLGYQAAVSELDARTGEVLRTFDGTAQTAEILYHQGVLVLTVLQDDRARVVLTDADSGKHVWTSENDYGGTTTDYYRFRAMHGSVPPAKVDPTLNTATDGQVIALLDGEDVVCLDFETGKEKWRKPFPLVEADYKAGGIKAMRTVWTGTLIVHDGVVVHASPNQLAAFSADAGRILWTQPKKYLQHLWFEWKDVFVIEGLVWTWSAELERGKLEGSRKRSIWPVTVNGYDLHSGELRKKVPLGNIFKTHHHHRCYRNKATSRYILASRRGTEYVDLEQGRHTIHNWVRGTCHLGMMPANGLHYAPPHPCVCYIDEKINGFSALAPARKAKVGSLNRERLEKGPAYGEVSGDAPRREDWPAFRQNAMRSGSVETEVAAQPGLLWQKQVGRKLTAPVVADGQVFVSSVDEHHLVALNGADGRQHWEYAAGGRVDSPPTYHRGTLLFGSADGWVYCVRAADGRLVWRFRAAPEERLISAFGRLESAWPVHGSILVMDGTAYFAAGRSSHLDGGIYLFGVDAGSGKVLHRTRLEGPYYNVDNISQNYQLPMGAIGDVLQGDDGLIYMRDMVFNAELEQQKSPAGGKHDRVRTKAAFLDDSYFKRTPWTFGRKGHYGRLIVHDEKTAYFVRMFDSLRGLDPDVYFTPGRKGYLLFAVDKNTGEQTWQRRIPVRVNAMVATADRLFVAGSPDVVDPNDPLGAFEGRKGGVIYTCSKGGGEILWRRVLSAPPVFNGLAAANNCLYLAMQDGSVACFGKTSPSARSTGNGR
jgi:outer membrane protein assembly factor BamB